MMTMMIMGNVFDNGNDYVDDITGNDVQYDYDDDVSNGDDDSYGDQNGYIMAMMMVLT